MAEYRILTENDKIEALKESFEDSIMGMGLKLMCDIDIEQKNEHSSTLILKTKDPTKEISPAEFFTLGLIIGRDYLNAEEKEHYVKLQSAMNQIKRALANVDKQ